MALRSKKMSPSSTRALAHQFDDPAQQFAASSLGMWAFIATEILFFGGLFAGYSVYRLSYPDGFAAASHHLDIVLGTVNTAVLIGSSLTMALAIFSARFRSPRMIVVFLLATLVLGTVFLGIKGAEYSHKFHEHLIPGANFSFPGANPRGVEIFFSFYFAMTGLHALHMVIGAALLVVMTIRAWRGHFSAEYYTPVEMVGLYWHFVDVIWIFLFPLLYLIGRH
jgi:cytochrome c oxidase subunit III